MRVNHACTPSFTIHQHALQLSRTLWNKRYHCMTQCHVSTTTSAFPLNHLPLPSAEKDTTNIGKVIDIPVVLPVKIDKKGAMTSRIQNLLLFSSVRVCLPPINPEPFGQGSCFNGNCSMKTVTDSKKKYYQRQNADSAFDLKFLRIFIVKL